jgi:hypothetical protein
LERDFGLAFLLDHYNFGLCEPSEREEPDWTRMVGSTGRERPLAHALSPLDLQR